MLQRWRFAWAWFLGAALVTVGCGAWPPWNPTPPEPQPTPTPWECALPYPGCHEYDPPLHCSSEGAPCWHNPTQNPEHCEEAPKCDEPPPPELPQPQCPTFTDRGGTLRLSRVQGQDRTACDCWFGQVWHPCPDDGCAKEADLVASTCGGQVYNATVKEATVALGDLSGQDPQENLKTLAAKIKEQSGRECVFGGIEALFLLRGDGLYEENHAVFFGDASWTGNGFGKFIGCHEDTDPTEPPSGECVDPDPTGYGAEFNLKKHGPDWDSTYRVTSREYCDQVCSPTEPDVCFTGRSACPLRFEGDPERKVCEEQEIGEQKWWCDGQPIDSNENPAQARCHGAVKTCTENGVTCAEADW